MNRQAWVDGGQTTRREERIWFRVDGSGPTLLFAHGFPTSSHDYAPIIEHLAKDVPLRELRLSWVR
ncbi:MAG: hypothetical protein IPG76_04050 [Acidobacteria bacterium]|nr:hypothetical protein [Acidobacteriota bacterium]